MNSDKEPLGKALYLPSPNGYVTTGIILHGQLHASRRPSGMDERSLTPLQLTVDRLSHFSA
jgi:hypothetical protein